jgi:hypothetical protein
MQSRIIVGSCAILMFGIAPVTGQVRDAASKANGSAYRDRSAQSYGRAASSHAEALGGYAHSGSPIPADAAAEHGVEANRNVAAAQKELAKLQPQAKDDQAVAGHVDTLNKHYDNARAHARVLEAEGAKGSAADAKKVTSAAEGLTAELQAAGTEHDRLIETLKAGKTN